MGDDTSIRVSEELADELYQRKGRAKSYEDFLWELLERLDRYEEQAGDPEPREPDVTPTPPTDPTAEESADDLEPAPIDDAERDRLIDEVPSSGDLAERRADEILKMYDLLRERGEAEKSDLLGVVDVEATEYASAASVWSNMVKGRDTLRALPGVETPPEGRTKWRYNDG